MRERVCVCEREREGEKERERERGREREIESVLFLESSSCPLPWCGGEERRGEEKRER